jgi:hypothetical protein
MRDFEINGFDAAETKPRIVRGGNCRKELLSHAKNHLAPMAALCWLLPFKETKSRGLCDRSVDVSARLDPTTVTRHFLAMGRSRLMRLYIVTKCPVSRLICLIILCELCDFQLPWLSPYNPARYNFRFALYLAGL